MGIKVKSSSIAKRLYSIYKAYCSTSHVKSHEFNRNECFSTSWDTAQACGRVQIDYLQVTDLTFVGRSDTAVGGTPHEPV